VPDGIYDEQLYRAMDFLLAASDELQKRVFFSVADLLNLEVDLVLYDTTSSYFEMEDDDLERAERAERWAAHDRGEGPAPTRPRPQVVNDPPLRLQGNSKDKRPDLAQVVIGLAVTREGIPVRCWCWPGNTNDATTVAEVKQSLAGWRLNRVVWVVDRGMVSHANLKELRRGGAHYVAGKKVRSGEADAEAALTRAGRYHEVADNLWVKEAVVGDGENRRRFVVMRNPAQAERDREHREQAIEELQAEIEWLNRSRPKDETGRQAHTKAVCALRSHPTKGRYVRELKNGELRINRAAVKAEERLDGKYLVITSDDSLSTEDVALSYKQLAEVEAAWRTLKSDLDLRPNHHRKADRIRAHVLVCWLALLLVRVTEVRTGQSWWNVRREMDRMHRGVFESPKGRFVQRTDLTHLQRRYLKALGLPEPPQFESIAATAPQPEPEKL
jgi:transposase